MIDIKFLRENPDIVKQNIKNKFQDSKLPLVDEVIEIDAQSRKVKGEADNLRASRNKNSKMIGGLMAQGKKEEAEASSFCLKSKLFWQRDFVQIFSFFEPKPYNGRASCEKTEKGAKIWKSKVTWRSF